MYLVTGATGNSGSELVRILSRKGLPTRAFSNDEKPGDLPGGVEYVRGDYGDEGSVRHALEGVTRAYLLSPFSPSQVAHESSFVTAAEAAGVELVVKLSSTTPDRRSRVLSPIHRGHGEIEELIQQTKLNYVFLRPNYYMQNFRFMAAGIAKENAVVAPAGNLRFGMIDTRDIAEVAAVCLQDAAFWNRRYLLAGAPITFHDVASELSRVLNRTVRYQPVPVEDFTRGLAATMPTELVDVLANEWRLAAAGGLSIFSDHVELITGTKPRTFGQFVENHANLFA